MKMQTKTLGKIAVFGGFVVGISGLGMHYLIQQKLRESLYYKHAVSIVMNNRPLLELLGEPVKFGNIDLNDRKRNHSNTTEAKFEVPIKGSKKKGTVYLLATRSPDPEDSNAPCPWELIKLEFELKDKPNYRVNLVPHLKSIK